MKDHVIAKNILSIAMKKIACGLDEMEWDEVFETIIDVYQHSEITIFACASGQEIKEMPALEEFDTENVSETFKKWFRYSQSMQQRKRNSRRLFT